MDEEWLTVPEVARILKITERTVREWLRKGKLHGVNHSGRTGWRVRRSDLDKDMRKAGESHG